MVCELDIPFRLKGELRWSLIDRRGQVVQRGQQENLILDSGLDELANQNLLVEQYGLNYAAVGTGTGAPDPTQTQLEAEIARTSSTLGFAGATPVEAVDKANGIWRRVFVRAFNYNQANGNLTEWGFTWQSSGGPFFCRELFRDSQGNPVVVTKTSDYRLVLTYTLTVTMSPNVATPVNFSVSGLGTITGQAMMNGDLGDSVHYPYTWPAPAAGEAYLISPLEASASSAPPGWLNELKSFGPKAWLLDAAPDMTQKDTPPSGVMLDLVAGVYTPGTFTRVFSFELGPGNADRAIYGFGLGSQFLGRLPDTAYSEYLCMGYKCSFDTPITKLADYRLRFDVRITWGRG